MNDLTGILYIVATPIGNLQDITQRALETFSQVDLIAAEDTRHSGLLLSHYGIKKPFFALHDHNEQEKAHVLVEKLKQGTNIALISDAGTPLISDPGFHLVRQCREAGIKVCRYQVLVPRLLHYAHRVLHQTVFVLKAFYQPKPRRVKIS